MQNHANFLKCNRRVASKKSVHVDLRSAPPRCATAIMNFSCSSGVHRIRVFAEAEAEAEAVAPEDGLGLPGEAAEMALVEAIIQKERNPLKDASV